MKKIILFYCFLFIQVCFIIATPAYPKPIRTILPNGKQILVRQYGDEKFHYFTTLEGYPIKKGKDGYFYYLYTTDNHELICSDIRINTIKNKRTVRFLRKLNKEDLIRIIQLQINSRKVNRKKTGINKITHFPTTATQKSLVILVEFSNQKFSMNDPRISFDNLLNQKGYSENGGTGSCKDYYMENSNGSFTPDFKVYGPLLLSKEYKYYGENNINGDDIAPEKMVIEACQKLDDIIDFSEYDTNKDGKVDNVYIFYAGYGEADSGQSDRVWPHSYTLEEQNIILDGVKLSTYACSNEINYATKKMNGIGTFTHEFGHVLGLPDLYATQYTNAFTPDAWCLMDYGMYNNNGNTPPYMSTYERYSLGWIKPKELNKPSNVVIDTLSNNIAYVIKTNFENEYFLLENRQQQGWDTYIPGHGMLVWHIDYNKAIWENNIVNNNPEHQYVDIEEADNIKSLETISGDAFPGTANITQITDDTEPNLKTWAGLGFGKSITDIEEHEGKISFLFMGGETLTTIPEAKPATSVGQTYFTANWYTVENATYYILNVYQRDEQGNILRLNEYTNKNVGNVTSFLVQDVEAGSIYYYSVCAADKYSQTKASNEIKVQTLDATFELLVPQTLSATNITGTSFVANWQSLKGAINYKLSVFQKNRATPTMEETIDFTGGLQNILKGWKTNCTSTISIDGYYGKQKPALIMGIDGSYISSPTYDKEVSQLSFWLQARGNNIENTISIMGFNGKKWRQLEILEIPNGKTISIDPDLLQGNYAVQLIYNKKTPGNAILDDITLKIGADVSCDYLESYDKKEVGNTSSYFVDNLSPGMTYYYTIQAYDGQVYSQESNEIKITTIGESTLFPLPSSIKYYIDDNKLYILSKNALPELIRIFSLSGNMMKEVKLANKKFVSIEDLSHGVYLLQINEETIKIVL